MRIPAHLIQRSGAVHFNGLGQPVWENETFIPLDYIPRQALNVSPEDFRNFKLNDAQVIPDNATGVQILIDTLTYLNRREAKQTFYEFNVEDIVPTEVGQGAFSQDILRRQSLLGSGDFTSGNIKSGSTYARKQSAQVAITNLKQQIQNWAWGLDYDLFELKQCLVANNFDLVGARHDARKKIYDIGIQKTAVLGLPEDPDNFPGFLNSTAINTKTTFPGGIAALISTLNYTQFQTVVQGLVAQYQQNCNYTAMPTRFQIPQDDWNALAMTMISPEFGSFSGNMAEYLESSFKKVTGDDSFKLVHLADANQAQNPAGVYVYTLYNHNIDNLVFALPLPYTVSQPNTADGFTYSDTAYAQYTGVQWIKPLTALRYQFSVA